MSKLISMAAEHYENHLDNHTPKWFAVYTHFKREKACAKELQQSGIEVYVPVQTVTRRYTRKVKKLQLPLIPNYAFVKITRQEYVRVLQSPYVINFVKIAKNLLSIPKSEIELVKRVIGEGEEVRVDNKSFEIGDRVEVIGGQLTGLKGTLVEKENNAFLRVYLSNIGLALEVSIAANLVQKIGVTAEFSN